MDFRRGFFLNLRTNVADGVILAIHRIAKRRRISGTAVDTVDLKPTLVLGPAEPAWHWFHSNFDAPARGIGEGKAKKEASGQERCLEMHIGVEKV